MRIEDRLFDKNRLFDKRIGEVRNGDQKVRKYLFPEIFYGRQEGHKNFVLLLRVMAKNGSSKCFLAKNGCTLKARADLESKSGRECCWPYLIGQHPLSPVFGQKRPGTPGNSYFAQLPPVFGHFMFLSGGLLECSNRSTWASRTINSKISDQLTWKFYHFSVNNFGGNQLYPVCLGDIWKLYYTSPNHKHLNVLTFFPSDWGMLRRSRCVLIFR